MATIAIFVLENKDVITADVTGAYLQIVMTDYVIAKIRGKPSRIMWKVNQTFKSHITTIVKRHYT